MLDETLIGLSMPVEVLVYDSVGANGEAVYGHVIGTDYTFEISPYDVVRVYYSNDITQAGTGVVFAGNNTVGYDETLVFSNGSTSTVLSDDANGNFLYDPHSLSELGDQTVFLARTDSIAGHNSLDNVLMITNGGEAPGVLFDQLVTSYRIVGNSVYAVGEDNDLYRIEANGNYVKVYDRVAGTDPFVDAMFEFQGELWFYGSGNGVRGLYHVDAQTNTTSYSGVGVSIPNSIYVWDGGFGENQFYFWAATAAAGTDFELWVSDGTAGGTQLVEDIRPGTVSSYYGSINYLATLGDLLIFAADDGGPDDEELWVSDGTAAGTFNLSGTGTPAGALSMNGLRVITAGSHAFFVAYDDVTGTELYVTDGTVAGTNLVRDINPNTPPYAISSDPNWFFVDGENIYFSISNGEGEDGVWFSDGTYAGTYPVSDAGGYTFNYQPYFINVVDLELDNIPVRELNAIVTGGLLTGDFLFELFNGSEAVDYLFGNGGNDTLNGNGGADWLYGGVDNDTLNGGAGSDLMFGEAGSDIMNGGADGDYMWGGSESDTMHGNDGVDWLRGEEGIDYLYGDAGDDVLIGGSGDDQMWGGTDTDTFYGEDDNDWIYGEANGDVAFGQLGNDHIYGGSEGDFLFGGAGADVINGGTENDLMWGAMPGMYDGFADTFEFDANWGFDAVYDFELGVDQVRFNSVAGLMQFSNLTLIDGGANVTAVFGADAITFYGVTQAELEAVQSDFSFT